MLKEKEIIQSFVWNFYLNKIDQTNPYEISKFEKEIKKLTYSIQDETLRKYVLEDFLEKINKDFKASSVLALSSVINIGLDTLKDELWKILNSAQIE